MPTQDNVIDGRNRFQQRGDRGGAGASLEERVAAMPRVPVGDKHVLAANLGRLASRLDPASPLSGAKRIVQASGHDGLWQKRKRFIRLPTENATPSCEPGDYGSSGSTFVALARAAGKLLAANEAPEAVEREQERSVRTLLNGTSFLPHYTPLTKSDRNAKSLLDDYASAVLSAINERTRIQDLWTILQDSPVGLDARSADDDPFEMPLGGAEKVPDKLLRPMFRPHIVEAMFRPEAHHLSEWQNPMVELGFIALRFETRMFPLPSDVAELFHPSKLNEDYFCLSSKAVQWLENVRWSRLEDPQMGEWKSAKVSAVRKVGLTIGQGEEREPGLRLSLWGGGSYDEPAAAYGPYGWSNNLEDQIVASGGNLTQLRSVYFDEEQTDSLTLVLSDLVPSGDCECDHVRVLGILPDWWNA